MDQLTKWLRANRPASKKVGRSTRDYDSQYVQQLVERIPQEIVARSAFRFKAYARAILHFEQYIRRADRHANKSAFFQELQQFYSEMEEPDGMEGITLKLENLTLEQQIVDHETAGRWADSQTCYELALQGNAPDIKHHIGLLNCLKSLGNLETMLTHVKGALTVHSNLQDVKILNSLAVEACWRLGKWNTLQDFLSRPCIEDQFEVPLLLFLFFCRTSSIFR